MTATSIKFGYGARLGRRAARPVLIGCILCMPLKGWAYGIDGMFGGRPNPDGSITVEVPLTDAQAAAQPARLDSVDGRYRPDYQPEPLHIGSFVVNPTVESGAAYNSNIYATPQATGGIVYTLHPALTAVSDWGRNMLAITTEGDFDFFQGRPDQDLTTAVLQVNGRYDLIDQSWLGGRAGYQMQNVPRYTLDNSQGSQPTAFNLYSAGVSAFHGAGIITAQLDYDFDRYSFTGDGDAANIVTTDGDQGLTAFNRNENTFAARLTHTGYGNFKPYVSAQYNVRTYDTNTARSSTGYHADIGANWDLGGIMSLGAYTGYMSQDYAHYGAQPVNQAVDFGGAVLWNVTQLDTIQLDVGRAIAEASITGFNSFLSSTSTATVTHELRRNILLQGTLGYAVDDYQGFATRQDDISSAGLGTRWLINRNLYADLDYGWTHRASSQEQQGYIEHLVAAKLGVRF